MYYDRFGRPPAQAHQPVSQPAGQTAPQPALLASVPASSRRAPSAPAAQADAGVLKTYLESHRTVWHAESLVEIYPEIVDYLDSRYVAARRDGGLRLRAVDGTYPDLDLSDDDLLLAAEALLSREYRHALFEQTIAPAIDRLTA